MSTQNAKRKTKQRDYKAVFHVTSGARAAIEPIYGYSQEGMVKAARRKLYGKPSSLSYDIWERGTDGTWHLLIAWGGMWQQ